ncbi:hypothetical protein Sliba_12140 [Streptomyces nigrescens]|uniref:Uncharacterized protein n=1 Tax=Streptomyces nigrescens TaxID=1920 RepID=A0A640TE33_STRNI|nr:hypothetical protein Sliba_12140 [Streptomyces libani subsp. libani]GGV88062.1 hypothetical protein GCM10010500_09550 [Streptomyces libani subsp. libani]
MRQGPPAYGPAGSSAYPLTQGASSVCAESPSDAPSAVPLSMFPSPVRAQERAAKNHCTIMQLSGRDLRVGALTLET